VTPVEPVGIVDVTVKHAKRHERPVPQRSLRRSLSNPPLAYPPDGYLSTDTLINRKVEAMPDRVQRSAGRAKEASGKAKKGAGSATGRPGTEARGAGKEAAGKAKNVAGKASSAVKKSTR
jgi:uncharacterized protein YjbJ (UPF0337 family)